MYSDRVQLAEASLLLRRQAAEEGVEVANHAFVLLDDLVLVLAGCTLRYQYGCDLTFWNVSYTCRPAVGPRTTFRSA